MQKKSRIQEREKLKQVEREEQKRKLARPPKDDREVIIGPTTGSGPDITLQ